jgi:uncharacterized protein (DUF736 family)
MANNGFLTHKQDGSYHGKISTLTLDAQIIMTPIDRVSERAPGFRVTSGEAEVGAGWVRTIRLRMHLTSPSSARLVAGAFPIKRAQTEAGSHRNVNFGARMHGHNELSSDSWYRFITTSFSSRDHR